MFQKMEKISKKRHGIRRRSQSIREDRGGRKMCP